MVFLASCIPAIMFTRKFAQETHKDKGWKKVRPLAELLFIWFLPALVLLSTRATDWSSDDALNELRRYDSNALSGAYFELMSMSNRWQQTKSDLAETASKLDKTRNELVLIGKTANEAHEMANSSNVTATLARAEATATEAAVVAQTAQNNEENKFPPRGISDEKLIRLARSLGNIGNGRSVWFSVNPSIADSQDFANRIAWVLVNIGFKFEGEDSVMEVGDRQFDRGISVRLIGDPTNAIVGKLIDGFNSIGIPAKMNEYGEMGDGERRGSLYISVLRP